MINKKWIYVTLILFNMLLIIQLGNHMITFLVFIMNLVSPIIIAFILSYITLPLLNILKKYVNKYVAVFLLISCFIYIISFLSSIVVPILKAEVETILNNQEMMDGLLIRIDNYLGMIPLIHLDSTMIIKYMEEYLNSLVSNIGLVLKNTIILINNYFLMPIIYAYLLCNFDDLQERIKKVLVAFKFEYTYAFFKESLFHLLEYFKCVIYISIILFLMYTTFFSVLNIKFGILLSVLLSFFNFIPYIGATMSFVAAILFTSIFNINKIIPMIFGMGIIASIDGNFITPYVESKRMSGNFILSIVAFIVFGELFGIMGYILSPILLKTILIFKENVLKYYYHTKNIEILKKINK